jgi:hypothetical protein
MKNVDECLEAFTMRPCRETQNEVVKEGFQLRGLTFIITRRGGFIYNRLHLESLRECSARVAAYREFISVYHVIGCRVDMDRRMAIGAKAIEKHRTAAIVPHYPGANSVVACAMKHSRNMFLNQMSPDANWVETGA